jgi:anti-sigma factor RsiW
MSCRETKTFIDAYLDGELDLVRGIELERHLTDCSACAALHEMRRTVQREVRNGPLRFRTPAELKKRVRAALVAQDRDQRVGLACPYGRSGLPKWCGTGVPRNRNGSRRNGILDRQ